MNTFLTILLTAALSFFLTTIFFNFNAHSEIEKNPNITLSEYWDGVK